MDNIKISYPRAWMVSFFFFKLSSISFIDIFICFPSRPNAYSIVVR